jgi:diketogulonate reductase-like aldo/keto reductase
MKESNTPREAIWLTTKLWPQGRNRAAAIAACEESLRRLGLDYVDLYLIHSPMERRLRGEQWLALEGAFPFIFEAIITRSHWLLCGL